MGPGWIPRWIPMSFDLRFHNANGWREYRVIAHSEDKELFATYTVPEGRLGNDAYPIESLMNRLEENEGTIDGKTLEELTGTYQDDEIDISNLI